MKLFSFFNKKDEEILNSDNSFKDELPQQKTYISGTKRDYSGLKTEDVSLKIWFPEAVKFAFNEMCSYVDTTESDLIRQTLFTYLYGRYDLMATIEKGEHDFALNGTPKFMRRRTSDDPIEKREKRTPELGKNMYDTKVWISNKMKADLKSLADQADLSMSEFTREIIISNLFGHTYLPERDELLAIKIKYEDIE